MMRIVMMGLVASLLAAPVMAQERPAANPAKLELARKVIDASGGAKNAEAMLEQAYGSMDALFSKMPAGNKRIMQTMQSSMREEMRKLLPVMIEQTVEIYARVLTEKELNDTLVWVTSDSGRSISRKTPQITQEAMTAQIPYLQEMFPRMLQKTLDTACEEAKCTPQERQQVTAMIAQAMPRRPS